MRYIRINTEQFHTDLAVLSSFASSNSQGKAAKALWNLSCDCSSEAEAAFRTFFHAPLLSPSCPIDAVHIIEFYWTWLQQDIVIADLAWQNSDNGLKQIREGNEWTLKEMLHTQAAAGTALFASSLLNFLPPLALMWNLEVCYVCSYTFTTLSVTKKLFNESTWMFQCTTSFIHNLYCLMSAKHQENDTPVKANHLLLPVAVCQSSGSRTLSVGGAVWKKWEPFPQKQCGVVTLGWSRWDIANGRRYIRFRRAISGPGHALGSHKQKPIASFAIHAGEVLRLPDGQDLLAANTDLLLRWIPVWSPWFQLLVPPQCHCPPQGDVFRQHGAVSSPHHVLSGSS